MCPCGKCNNPQERSLRKKKEKCDLYHTLGPRSSPSQFKDYTDCSGMGSPRPYKHKCKLKGKKVLWALTPGSTHRQEMGKRRQSIHSVSETRHHGEQLQLSPLVNSERWYRTCLGALSSKGQGSRAMVPQCPIHNWLSTASGALTHWHFWIALCAGPSMVHQAGKKKKKPQAQSQELAVSSLQNLRRQWHPTPVFLPGKSWMEEPGRLQSMESQRVGHD